MDFRALSRLDRRSFIKRAGAGSIALESLPILLATAQVQARRRAAGFNFTAISRAGTISGLVHAVNMPIRELEKHHVEGGGPLPALQTGRPLRRGRSSTPVRGTAKRLVSFQPIGTWGRHHGRRGGPGNEEWSGLGARPR
jgi:hypothetical protein